MDSVALSVTGMITGMVTGWKRNVEGMVKTEATKNTTVPARAPKWAPWISLKIARGVDMFRKSGVKNVLAVTGRLERNIGREGTDMKIDCRNDHGQCTKEKSWNITPGVVDVDVIAHVPDSIVAVGLT
jgi:hypothetical protein